MLRDTMLQELSEYNCVNCENCQDKPSAVNMLSEVELHLLNDNSQEVTFQKGEIILSEGSGASDVYFLRKGLVKEYGRGYMNNEYILQILKQQSYLGLNSIVSDNMNQYSYMALTNVTVCCTELSVFLQLIKENGRFGYEILSTVCRDSIQNYHRFIDQHQKRIYGKVADALLYFSDVIFKSESFQLPLNRKEIANMIGASRESVSKQICGFENDKILKMNGKFITILDKNKLKQISRVG